MKIDPGMHIGLHLVFFGKTGVTAWREPAGVRALNGSVGGAGAGEICPWEPSGEADLIRGGVQPSSEADLTRGVPGPRARRTLPEGAAGPIV
jgi:hypothetical protein